jgi:hypothetical protein
MGFRRVDLARELGVGWDWVWYLETGKKPISRRITLEIERMLKEKEDGAV